MGRKHKKHKSRKYQDEEEFSEEVVREERVLPKLVLKVHKEEKVNENFADDSDDYRKETHKDKHKKKKKKDKKHKHKHEESKKNRKREHVSQEDDFEPPVKKIHIKMSDLPVEEPPQPQIDSNGEKKLPALQLCLENLHRTLQRKDTFGIFTYPVTDAIAPNYSKVVKNPMDFSTMMYKIEHENYSSIRPFKDDFILMCKNAMLYNAPDTIYYKAGEKLYNVGMKTLSEDKIQKMMRSIGITDGIDYQGHPEYIVDDIGMIDVDTLDDDDFNGRKKNGRNLRRSAEQFDITSQVLNAAKEASERLRKKYKDPKMGFLRRDAEGNTSLAVLNPDTVQGQNSLPVNLGKLSGKLTSGSSTLNSLKEDKKNKVIPVSYLSYGPYGSFGPTYDSSMSNITKEDSQLLLETYGSDVGIHYAKSLQTFVKDSASFAQNLVDRFLDALTDGSHTRLIRKHEQKEKQKSQQRRTEVSLETKQSTGEQKTTEETTTDKDAAAGKQADARENVSNSIDFDSLMTLNKDGIDVSFLKDLLNSSKENKALAERDELQIKLDENAKFLNNLKTAQDERLLKKPQDARVPSETEMIIAENLTGNIKELLTKVRPGDVVSQDGIRSALGIGVALENESEADKSEVVSESRGTDEPDRGENSARK